MRRNPEEIIVEVKQLKIECNNKKKWQRSKTSVTFLNADKHSPASSARSIKRRVRGDAYVSGS